jgi:hypothetical protein
MTQVVEILAELQRRGVSVEVHGDMLRLRPKRLLDVELLARVRQHKAEVLYVLSRRPASCAASCYEIEPGRWIHRAWDGCNTQPRPQPVVSVPSVECRHCGGAGECFCPTCTLRRTEKPVPCLMCRPEKRQAWLAATRPEGRDSENGRAWTQ